MQRKHFMLSDVEKGNNLMLTRLTSVATLTDTKEQSGTTSFSTQILTFSLHLRSRRDAGGGSRMQGWLTPLKPTKVTFITMIYKIWKEAFMRPFCRPLFCHNSVVKHTSSLIKQWTRCQAKFLTSAKFLTCYCFSVISFVKIKIKSFVITFLMCVV